MAERTNVRLFLAETPSPRLVLKANPFAGGTQEIDRHAASAHASGATDFDPSKHSGLGQAAVRHAGSMGLSPAVHARRSKTLTTHAKTMRGPSRIAAQALSHGHATHAGDTAGGGAGVGSSMGIGKSLYLTVRK
jgi:hypothetical protein